jgi:NAD(P)-dependent dehydrogenase (short-subunit alcohol dehydrogenase family)
LGGQLYGDFRPADFHRVPPLPPTLTLQEKTAIITGASSGLGTECARQILQLQPNLLILAVRSQSKGDATAATLQAEFPKARIEVWILDMESYDSVRDFAKRCETLPRLDAAILNAGLGKMHYARSGPDGKGREVTIQVNYLTTVLLTILLTPLMTPK